MPEKKKTVDYPDHTTGSKLAAKVRQRANKLTDAQREECFKHGMAMIYGADGTKKTASSRH